MTEETFNRNDTCNEKDEFRPFGKEEAEIIAAMMKRAGASPYIYIGLAYDLLASGYVVKALDVLAFAGSFSSLFYEKGSLSDNDYRESVELLRFIIENYPDEYRYMLKECNRS